MNKRPKSAVLITNDEDDDGDEDDEDDDDASNWFLTVLCEELGEYV